MFRIRDLKLIKYIKRHAFHRFFLYSLIPVICVLLVSTSVYVYYIKFFEKETINNHEKILQTVTGSINNIFFELYQNNYFFSSNSDFSNFISSYNQPDFNGKYYEVKNVTDLFGVYRSSKDYIDMVYLYSNANMVVSSSGTMDSHLFFETNYNYEKYEEDFWMNEIGKKNIKTFEILLPSKIESMSIKTGYSVIPVVYKTVGFYNLSGAMVVNLNCEKLSSMLAGYKITPNSTYYVLDKDGNLFFSSDKTLDNYDKNHKVLSTIIDGYKQKKTITAEINGTLYIINNTKNLTNSFYYIAAIPKDDFLKQTNFLRYLMYAVILFMLLLSVLLAYFSSKKIYSPIGKLVNTLSSNFFENTIEAGSPRDEFDFIRHEISSLKSQSDNLSKDLSFALPLISEQFLLMSLNRNDFYNEEAILPYLKKQGVLFQHPFFIASILQLNFKKNFFQDFTQEEQNNIFNGILELLKYTFDTIGQTYVLTMDQNRLCVILNLKENNMVDDISNAFEAFIDKFKNDFSMVEFFSGIGNIYPGLPGLNESYNEALKALGKTSSLSAKKIIVYNKEDGISNYVFAVDDQNKLFNYLLGGYETEFIELLNIIINNNISKNISTLNLKELYIRLYHIGIRVLNNNELSPQILYAEEFCDLNENYFTMPVSEISDYLTDFFKRILKFEKTKVKSLDVSPIKGFIDSNYQKDIYLSLLAEKYNISVPYLSQILSEKLGMNFSKYLSMLRINKAKELLLSTKMNLDDIADSVGYNSRNTLIRMFKKMEGINPSEYKKNIGGNKM